MNQEQAAPGWSLWSPIWSVASWLAVCSHCIVQSSLLWLIESLYLCLFGYQVIHVNFDKFAVEDDAYCRFDYVAFFNGGERDDSRLIGKYCGDQVPEWVTEISEAFKVVLK